MPETPPTVDEPVARDETPRARQRTPWRVEGARDAPEKGARGSQMPGRRHLWWIVVAMLALNWVIASRASVDHQRITVPYSYFRQQALVNNIAEVSSKDETIEGKFRRNVRYRASYLRGRIAGALGGRAAEAVVFGDVTTGAESDLEQATALARQMVGRWGMSEKLGLVSVLPGPGQEGLFFPGTESLLAHETLDEPDAYRAAGLPPRPAGAEDNHRLPVASGNPPS